MTAENFDRVISEVLELFTNSKQSENIRHSEGRENEGKSEDMRAIKNARKGINAP